MIACVRLPGTENILATAILSLTLPCALGLSTFSTEVSIFVCLVLLSNAEDGTLSAQCMLGTVVLRHGRFGGKFAGR